MLVTRPEPGASETAGRVAAMGLSPVVAPLLMIEHLPCKLPEPTELSAVLVTSGNAVPAIPPGWHGVRLFAVGDATARQARHAGFASVESADGDGDALAALVARRLPPGAGPILLASGEGQGEALAEALRVRGFVVTRREVYAARPVPKLPDTARTVLESGSLRAALFFSAETARVFIRLVRAAALESRAAEVTAVAIGPAAGMALSALPWHAIRIAARPNQDQMLAMLR